MLICTIILKAKKKRKMPGRFKKMPLNAKKVNSIHLKTSRKGEMLQTTAKQLKPRRKTTTIFMKTTPIKFFTDMTILS